MRQCSKNDVTLMLCDKYLLTPSQNSKRSRDKCSKSDVTLIPRTSYGGKITLVLKMLTSLPAPDGGLYLLMVAGCTSPSDSLYAGYKIVDIFEPVNTFMHNCNIFLNHNLCKCMRVINGFYNIKAS
jgi:hypothetical protein